MTTNESRDDPADTDQLMDYLRMDLVSKDYDRLWEIICELELQRGLSQELKPALDQHKPGVMRSLLNTMSILSTDDIGYFVPQAISGLRRLGVDWPDLEILERSYRADMKRASARNKVDEDWSMGKPAPQEINDLFDFLEHDDEINAVASLYRLADADLDAGYAEEIAPYKQLIIRGMLRWAQGEDEWAPTVLGAIDTLRSIGLDWPELSAISKSAQSDRNRLNEDKRIDHDEFFASMVALIREDIAKRKGFVAVTNLAKLYWLYGLSDSEERMLDRIRDSELKPVIIYRMLEAIKEGHESLAKDLLGDVWRLEADWPELETIDTALYPDDHKHIREAWSKTYKKSINCNNPKGFSQRAHCAARRKRQAGGKTKSKSVSEAMRKLMDTDGSADKEQLKQEARTMVIDMLRRDLATNGDRGIYLAMYHMDDWNLHIRNWPELGEMIDDHKRQIVTELLRTIKGEYGHDTDGVRRLVERMRKIGVDWSELRAIERSLNATNTLSLDESDYQGVKYMINGVLSSIEGDEPREMVLFLSNLVYTDLLPSLVHELVKQLNIHKPFIVKALLEFLKYESDDAEPDDTVRDCLLVLDKIGISSPELDIINRSLAIRSTNPNAVQLDELTGYRADPVYAASQKELAPSKMKTASERDMAMEKLTDYLETQGFKHIGQGSFSEIYIKQGYPWMFKLWSHDQAYLWYITWAAKNQDIPNVPRVKGLPVKIAKDTYVVRLEKLRARSSYDHKQLATLLHSIESLDDLSKEDVQWLRSEYPGIYEILRVIQRAGTDFVLDLHSDNIMMRGQTPVLADPVVG